MAADRRSGPDSNDRELRLTTVWRALTYVFAAAVLTAGGVFYTLVVLLDVQDLKSTTTLDAKTLFDLVKLSFGVVAGSGALVALVVAYRRQRVDEAGAHREATRLHTERFSQAVDKLGSDSPAVRLGGVHALAGLADDAPDTSLRQTCIDVLCAYLRLPYTPDPGDDPAHLEEHHRYLALREVRHTILRLIGDHYRLPAGTHHSWQGCDLDLTGITIDGPIDFSRAVFSNSKVSFRSAVFSRGIVSFKGATFFGSRVSFDGAVFSGSRVPFDHAVFSGGEVSFGQARFSRGTVSFDHAVFSGGIVSFDHAAFSGSRVSFDHAAFSGSRVSFSVAAFSSNVTFSAAVFSGGEVSFYSSAFSSNVTFSAAVFSGGEVSFKGVGFFASIVSFSAAVFSGGTASFEHARFSGGIVSFSDAEFSGGIVSFARAEFSGGIVSFARAEFSGSIVSFARAEFSGSIVSFARAEFSGSGVHFSEAVFSGGEVSFGDASGPAPNGLLAVVGSAVPTTVALAPTWLPTAQEEGA
ncbi:pentapeptide repeat-containing protein [Streptomyces zaomyceticus]|uniref:pentapeptide repeat-containing protein n=1 Tax=Streptomyces zaomyceticus TaxID=68286 RepID=UPI00364D2BB7